MGALFCADISNAERLGTNMALAWYTCGSPAHRQLVYDRLGLRRDIQKRQDYCLYSFLNSVT
jgi:hypothetical protein